MAVLRRIVLLSAAVLVISAVSEAVVDPELQTRCGAQTSCRDCIREDPGCAWCADTVFSDSRCYAVDPDAPNTMCTNTQNPSGGLTGMSMDNFENLNQIVPTRADVSVRPGATVTFPLEVQPANNFPIDLYLLMDLSFSMQDDLANLRTLGVQIAQRIEQISTNFTIGFGSFVEKRLGSFVNVDPRRLIDPCFPGGCETPYSYRHVVSLTRDNNLFSAGVNSQMISGNQDFPEGGFDGFLQSIVCTNVIGWRDVSRKLLLYISDAGFHFAGDGLLGGVVRPHDGQCHMEGLEPESDGDIIYQDWDTLDYPSIGQIAEKLDQFDIIPIFAVTDDYTDLYELLRAELGERAYTGVLASDSSNVVDLVETLYNEISQRIVFAPQSVPGVSVNVMPTDCSAGRLIDGVCSEVGIGETVRFNVSVTVTECTEELANPTEVAVRVLGFGTFTINLTAICSCPCEDMREENSTVCNMQGSLVCGTCECNRGYFGENCQCNSTGQANGMDVECPRGLQNLQCSGRGVCTCGICDCRSSDGDNRFYGAACECDNTVCERGIGGEICSGPSRGECTCDGCRCLPEAVTGELYTLSDCSCTPNTQTCRDPANATDVCNGRGECMCGECQCTAPYFGTYCELCSGDPVCQLGTCNLDSSNALCARCVIDLLEVFRNQDVIVDELLTEEFVANAIMNGTLPAGSMFGMLADTGEDVIFLPESFSDSCNVTCPRLVIINRTTLVDYEIMGFVSTRCQYDPLDCDYRYYVALNPDDETLLPIHVEYPPVCPMSEASRTRSGTSLAIPPWAVALILIGILLILGIIALILLKVFLMLLDWIEVQKFEQELARTKYTKNENPLYRSAQKEYKNPIYGQ